MHSSKHLFKPSALAVAILAAGSSFSAVSYAKGAQLEEVMVTATRRAQSVEDIPYNISAVSGDALSNAGVTDMQSLTRMIPGLTSADLGPRSGGINSNLIIRGLNANEAASNGVLPNLTVPLVSTYVDETPLFINLKLNDIERVEVLRGPQGTLYGSGSMGGTLRLIHNKPNTEAFSADVSGKVSSTNDAHDLNYSVDGIFNFPISDTVAFRVGLGYEDIAGYIDAKRLASLDSEGQPVLADPGNPLNSGLSYHEEDDVDSADISYIRTALLWDISENVEAILTFHHQEDSSEDYSTQTIGYENKHYMSFTSPIESKADLYGLDVTADLGFATFTSSTSYYKNGADSVRDATAFMESVNESPLAYGGYPRMLSTMYEDWEDKSLAQEFRLVSNNEGNIDWVVGGFYRDQELEFNMFPQPIHGYAAWSELSGSGDAISDFFGTPGAYDTFADFLEMAPVTSIVTNFEAPSPS